MQVITGTVDNVTHNYEPGRGKSNAFSSYVVSFAIDKNQAHFRSSYPPSINPGDQLVVAGAPHHSGLKVYAFANRSNGTYGTYYLATFYWLAVVTFVLSTVLVLVGPALVVFLGPWMILAGVVAYFGHRARSALSLCRGTAKSGTRPTDFDP